MENIVQKQKFTKNISAAPHNHRIDQIYYNDEILFEIFCKLKRSEQTNDTTRVK